MALSKGRYPDEYPSLEKMLKKQDKDSSVKGYCVSDKLGKNLDASNVFTLIKETRCRIEEITHSKIKSCCIAWSEVRKEKCKTFDFRNLSTWVVEGGVKATWNRLKSRYCGMVVLSLYEDNGTALSTDSEVSVRLPSSNPKIEYSCLLSESYADGTQPVICIAYSFGDEPEVSSETSNYPTAFNIKEGISSVPSEHYEDVIGLNLASTYVANLLDYDSDMEYKDLVAKMFLHTENLLADVEMKSKKRIVKYTIGQTFARQQKRKKFDYKNFKTFLKTGISVRWSQTYKPEGYDGLIALCAVTRESRPRNVWSWKWFDQIQCVKALEQRLIQHFLLDKVDPRIANTSFQTGKTATSAFAGVVYVAYMLSDEYSPIALKNPEITSSMGLRG